MKLSRKLPIAFTAVALVVACAGGFGLLRLNEALAEYRRVTEVDYANEQAISSMLVEFKTQVQEWKDTLLRGQDPQQLDKYWTAFQAHERKVGDAARALHGTLPDGEARQLVDQFAEAHATMGVAYRKGFALFRDAGFEAAAGDAAVKGQDRKPAALLDQARERITADLKARAIATQQMSARADTLSLAMMLLAFLAAVGGGVLLSRSITRPLDAAVAVAERVAAGELDVNIGAAANDETGQLLAALRTMSGKLSQMVSRIRHSSDQFTEGAGQIASGTVDLSARTEQQAAALEETASSMEQLTATVRQNLAGATEADQLARAASSVAARGGDAVSQVVGTMQHISADAKKISDIIAVIDGIAFQTNILALNAAVEAARAGEHGRGFAVVASEVRALAQRSAAAAKEIKTVITHSVERVDAGSRQVASAGATMQEVVASIQGVTTIMAGMLAATHSQSDGIEQINRALAELDEVTQHTAALMEEAAAAANSMREQAGELSDSVAVFQLGRSGARAVPLLH
ncbi:methyl-accepting chemotaxis protein [Massilia terrae]|uniref:methyl-accepting chemotaxis protein n=1 Tax=Massilia terrae TaxID=1811224 RepID=UPI0027D96A70|nr:methyl-accepting chemotaxis protein [Massilia terrae]